MVSGRDEVGSKRVRACVHLTSVCVHASDQEGVGRTRRLPVVPYHLTHMGEGVCVEGRDVCLGGNYHMSVRVYLYMYVYERVYVYE